MQSDPRVIAFSQLDRPLHPNEIAVDGLAAEMGFRPRRRMTVSAQHYVQAATSDPRSIHYRWPSPASQPYRAQPPQRQ